MTIDAQTSLGIARRACVELDSAGGLRERVGRVLRHLTPTVCDHALLELQEPTGERAFIAPFAEPERDRERASRDAEELAQAVRREDGERIELPLQASGEVVGVLIAVRRLSQPFETHACGALELVAGRIALHVELDRERWRSENDRMLLAIVSHGLRNPLAVLALAVTLLKTEELSPRQDKIVGRLDSASSHLRRLVSDLLDFTVARNGGIQIECIRSDLHAVVGAALEDLRATSPARSILHRRSGDGAVRIDRDRIAQIVANLVGNALQHSPRESTVHVETRGEPGWTTLSVCNDGDPIPPEVMPQLFAPLRRGPHAAARRGSLGLGLFIVRHLVLAHGGTIDVTSDAGGTCFTIRLPRV